MAYNSKVILYIAGILLTLCLLAYCLTNTNFYATMLTLGLTLAFQIAALLRLINYTNRQLSRFLLAIKHSDFSQSYSSSNLNSSFKELGLSFDELMQRFRQERSEKEAQATYLHTFVEQIPIAILALNDDNDISLCNKALRNLIEKQEVKTLAQVNDFNPELAQALRNLQPGQDVSLQIESSQESLYLTLSCSILRSQGLQQKIISIQNIQHELEAKEIQAWQNLIRVMTHEIMNSITPITSLADTSGQYVNEAKDILETIEHSSSTEIKPLLDDASSALMTIGNRGQGLMRFVDSYRSLTKLPLPKFRYFKVSELFNSVQNLMNEQASKLHLDFIINCHPVNLELNADPELLEQALINLLRNAFEATIESSNGKVTMQATLLEKGIIEIDVSDNGQGIDPENMENIFIPFFTTKRGGSGIGMSIVKQVAQLNGGSVKVISEPGVETRVVMRF